MKKIALFLKNNYIYIGILSFFILFNYGISYWEIKGKYSYFHNDIKYFILLLICMISPIILIVICKKIKTIQRKFLFLFTIIGLMFMIGLPMCATPDEGAHIYRAYEISEGHLFSKIYSVSDKKIVGRKLPKNFDNILAISDYKSIIENIKVKKGKERVVTLFDNTALYSFVCYIPQVFGIIFARLFTDSLLIQLYFGRLFNFLFSMALLYFAIKVLPTKKEILFFICLLPITIQEVISLSPDALTISASFAFISYILYLKNDTNKKISRKDIGILTALSITISLCKIVYLPLVFMLFLLPKSKFKSKKEKYIVLGLILLLVIILNLSWLKIASDFLKVSSKGKSSKQIAFILGNIFKYILICINTINEKFSVLVYQAFGKHLSWFSIKVPDIYIIINLILFIFMSLTRTDNNKFKLSSISRKIIFLDYISVIALIFTSLYIQWTEYKSDYIDGMQGRYFIPILLLIPFILYNNKYKINKIIDDKYIYMFIILQNICAFSLMIIYYI